MSNIISHGRDINQLKSVYSCIKENELNKELIEYVIKSLLPNEYKDMFYIRFSNSKLICYTPNLRYFTIDIDKLNHVALNHERTIKEVFKINTDIDLKYALLLSIISHEVEHAYQDMYASGFLSHESNNLIVAYRYIIDLVSYNKKNYSIERIKKLYSRLMYDMKHDWYLIERNAQVECYDLVSNLEDDESIKNIFIKLRNDYMKLGYLNNRSGSIMETMEKVGLLKKYEKEYSEEEFDEMTKLRYGLPVKEETRKLLLK